jgi:hypothetical protein
VNMRPTYLVNVNNPQILRRNSRIWDERLYAASAPCLALIAADSLVELLTGKGYFFHRARLCCLRGGLEWAQPAARIQARSPQDRPRPFRLSALLERADLLEPAGGDRYR